MTPRAPTTGKTYPIPSAKYDKRVCTAGVREDGSFICLYPISHRNLPFSQQFKKYECIQVADLGRDKLQARKAMNALEATSTK